ncbi:MAG: radical SAM protein [Planctomycetes bacterium]|nr:radical SAM protein [Planctomycetota bacterium]
MPDFSPWKKRFRLAAGYFKGRPMWCAWQITYRCNFRCSFCHYWKERPRKEEEQTLDDVRCGARKLAELSSLLISIAGGEPTLREDLPDVVRAIARYHFPFITTNGWRVTRQMARDLWKAGLWGASISIDYADAARHDAMRGVKGAHDRAVQALRYFVQERTRKHQRVNLMAVLNHENLDQVEPLVRLAKGEGAWFMVQPYCNLKTGDDTFRPPANGCAEVLMGLRRKHSNFLSNPVFLENFDVASNGGVPGCAAGRAFFNIDNYGRVAMCVEDRGRPVGSLRDDDIRGILRRLHGRHMDNQCKSCWYNCRGEIESLYTLRGALHSLPTLLMT